MPRPPINFKPLFRGAAIAFIATCFCVGGVMLAYRTAALITFGVRGQAVVTQYLGEVHVRRNFVSWTNYQHVLSFDGRTLERQMSQQYPVGATLDIVYVPGSNNLTLLVDNESNGFNVAAAVLMLLFGAGMGIVAYWSILDALGHEPPAPMADGCEEHANESFANESKP